jgi:hypothetical protein
MDEILDDNVVDSIAIQWQSGPGPARTSVSMPDGPGARLLRSFLTLNYWTGLLFMAEGIIEQAGRDVNDSGFNYPEDEDDEAGAETEPAETIIEVYNPYESVKLREPAFVRLMSRLYQAVIAGATRDGDAVTQTDWWPRFVEVAEAVRQRASE